MEKGPSKEDDNQRGKSEKEKISGSDQTSADDADVSTEAPSRVHIFKDKTSPDASSKSDSEELQCSSFRANTLIHSANGTGRAAIFVGFQPPIISLRDELTRLKHGIEKGKKALYEAAMKAEDLEAVLQALQRTSHSISQRRRKLRISRSARRSAVRETFPPLT